MSILMFAQIQNFFITFGKELLAAAGQSPFSALGYIMTHGGLVVFFPMLVWMLWVTWIFYVIGWYVKKQKYKLFAVDVPSVNEQSMAAVEQVIVALHGTFFNYNKKDQYWHGMLVEPYSLEIVSIDGYIQYFVWCNARFENVLKSAIYAQYPDAEITEVEDYTKNVPNEFPSDEYKIWGTQLVFEKPDVYPIKTYEYFEHSLTGTFADPLASILEQMSRLHEGEQVWLQLVITPTDGGIRSSGISEVDALIGKDSGYSPKGFEKFIFSTLGRLFNAGKPVHFEAVEDTGFGREGSDGNFMSVTTGEKVVIEEIQKKITRMQFSVKFRIVYLAKTALYDRYRVPGAIFGAIKQFNSLDLNSFKGGKLTTTSGPAYLFWQRRRHIRETKLVQAYQGRSNWAGSDAITMSSAEIATLFHFPLESAQAPLLSTTESKKAEPPTRLPQSQVSDSIIATASMPGDNDPVVPENLPMQTPTKMRIPQPGEQLPRAASIPVGPIEENFVGTTGQQPGTISSQLTNAAGEVPLHSMPGLPPGVRPITDSALPTPVAKPVSIPTPATAPAQPQFQPQQWSLNSRAQMEVGVNPKSIMPTPEEITDTVTQVANVIPAVAKKVTPEAVMPMIHAITDPIQQAAQAIPGIARSMSPQQWGASESQSPQPPQPQLVQQPQFQTAMQPQSVQQPPENTANRPIPKPVQHPGMQAPPAPNNPPSAPQASSSSAGAPPQNLPI